MIPWRSDLAWGATAVGDSLYFAARAQSPWQGRLLFTSLHPHSDGVYPRPYVIDPDTDYELRFPQSESSAIWQGRHLSRGLSVRLDPGTELTFVVIRQEPALLPAR